MIFFMKLYDNLSQCLLFFILTCFTFLWIIEPWQGDYWYNLDMKTRELTHVFTRYKAYYFGNSNGRFGQFFTILYIHSRACYVVLSNFFLLLVLFSCYEINKKNSVMQSNFFLYALTLLLLLIICIPDLGLLLFYIPINANYFVSTAIVACLLCLMYTEYRWYVYLPLVFFSFAAGMGNEHTGLAYLVGFLLVTFSNKLWLKNGILIFTYLLGFMALLFSPAALNRLKGLGLDGNIITRYIDPESLLKHAQGFYEEPQLICLFVAACTLVFFHCLRLNFNLKKCLRSPSVIWFVISLIIIFTIPASPFSKKRLLFAPAFTLSCVVVPFLLTLPGRFKMIRQAIIVYGLILTLVLTYKVGLFSITVNKIFKELHEFSLSTNQTTHKITQLDVSEGRLVNIFGRSYLCERKICLGYFGLDLLGYKVNKEGLRYTILKKHKKSG